MSYITVYVQHFLFKCRIYAACEQQTYFRSSLDLPPIYMYIFFFRRERSDDRICCSQARIYGVAAKAVSEKEKNNDTKRGRPNKEEKQTYDIEMN